MKLGVGPLRVRDTKCSRALANWLHTPAITTVATPQLGRQN